MITEQHINEFIDTGIVVIEDVLTDLEVSQARNSLHNDIYRRTGIHHSSERWNEINARLKGPGMYMYYAKWKLLDIHMHPRVVGAYQRLLEATYGTGDIPYFEHPFGKCDNTFCMADRVCYRLPDVIHSEGGLGLHLDRNPADPYLLQSGGLDKWRPIQGYVCLTNHFHNESGGLRVVRGFHKHIDSYFRGSAEAEAACGQRGEFFRMGSKSHAKLQKQLETVYAPCGSLVLWDSRLPHATCDNLSGYDSREVVYTGFLPDIEINRRYMRHQLKAINENSYPMYGPQGVEADRDWDPNDLTIDQRKLLGMNL